MGPIIELENVSVVKGPAIILENVTITVDRGEVLCITGRSGVGKTSLLRVISLLDKPASGTLRCCGKTIDFGDRRLLSKMRRDLIGYIPQHDDLIPQLTVRENIALPLVIARRKEDPVWVERLAQLLGIEGLLDRSPDELSGGQRRRVLIARALVKKPLVVVADEPLVGLDIELAKRVFHLLQDHAASGNVVVVAFPDPPEWAYCNKTYIIRESRLVLKD